jgi:hypothetical protein
MADLRSHLSENSFDTAWAAGQHMSLSEAFDFLLG